MLNRTGRGSSRTVLGEVMAHFEEMVDVGAIQGVIRSIPSVAFAISDSQCPRCASKAWRWQFDVRGLWGAHYGAALAGNEGGDDG